jgi:hypothetical protein
MPGGWPVRGASPDVPLAPDEITPSNAPSGVEITLAIEAYDALRAEVDLAREAQETLAATANQFGTALITAEAQLDQALVEIRNTQAELTLLRQIAATTNTVVSSDEDITAIAASLHLLLLRYDETYGFEVPPIEVVDLGDVSTASDEALDADAIAELVDLHRNEEGPCA